MERCKANRRFRIVHQGNNFVLRVSTIGKTPTCSLFSWYYPGGGILWDEITARSDELAAAGITALWLPPAYKGSSPDDVGYGVYDHHDLGEFNQKGTIRTKYGTKQRYLSAIAAAHRAGIQVYGDVVFNHKLGADFTERGLHGDGHVFMHLY
jgi:hypothetical protein